MSEKFTSVRIGDAPAYATRGHVSYSDALAEARQYYESQLAQAASALAAIRHGNVRVFHQTGIYRVRNRKEITES
jgi:hypothetical protein